MLSSLPPPDRAATLPLKGMAANRPQGLKGKEHICKGGKFLTSSFIIRLQYHGVWKSELRHIYKPVGASAWSRTLIRRVERAFRVCLWCLDRSQIISIKQILSLNNGWYLQPVSEEEPREKGLRLDVVSLYLVPKDNLLLYKILYWTKSIISQVKLDSSSITQVSPTHSCSLGTVNPPPSHILMKVQWRLKENFRLPPTQEQAFKASSMETSHLALNSQNSWSLQRRPPLLTRLGGSFSPPPLGRGWEKPMKT